MKIRAISFKEASASKAIFIPLFSKQSLKGKEIFGHLPTGAQNSVLKFAQKEFSGEEDEIKSLWLAQGLINRIALIGLGEKSKWNERRMHLIPRRIIRAAKTEKIKYFTVDFNIHKESFTNAAIFATNAMLADLEFNKYKKVPKKGWPEINIISLSTTEELLAETQKGIQEGSIIGEEANSSRDLANTPGGDITPAKLAEAARIAARKNGLKIKILDEREISKIGMGGIIGVSKGSVEKPKFIILEYAGGPKNQKPLVLVGKGVTFDTGGLNLKPDQTICEMHMDMSGGAAVIHGLCAIARLRLPINVIGLIPAAENSPSGSSYRPGDILKSLSGKTIEVLNTDAEGRIILADALTYALKYKPGFILDLATLTGAAHVALGNYCSAVFTNKNELQNKLTEIGEKSGDYVWPLPLWEEYLNDIKGNFGDLTNAGKADRWGGAIHGAKFLEQFVGDVPWAHLDIAPRMTTVESDILAKGASGVGVRYIVEAAKRFPELLC